MDITVGQLLAWVVVGALAGALATALTKRSRKIRILDVGNIAIGMIGAIVGGLLFQVLDINIGADLVFSFADVLSAFIGSLIVVVALWAYHRGR
jgi:uncharacterized membrane protein YeaQ/YmgE (transglycosylase-associated protein family)